MKALYIMQALWDSKRDLSAYDIQGFLYEEYQMTYKSITIERQLFRLSKKKFVHLYIRDHLLFAHRLIEKSEYRERTRLRLEEKEKRYQESFPGRMKGWYKRGNQEDEKKMGNVLEYLEKDKR